MHMHARTHAHTRTETDHDDVDEYDDDDDGDHDVGDARHSRTFRAHAHTCVQIPNDHDDAAD